MKVQINVLAMGGNLRRKVRNILGRTELERLLIGWEA